MIHRAKSSFSIDIAGVRTKLHFQEVSGLDPEIPSSKHLRAQKGGTVTLKRGVIAKDDTLSAWLDSGRRDTATPSTVTITLLDESGAPAMTWTLTNVRPAKVTAPDLNAGGNDVAIETLELSYDGLTIE